MRFASLPFHPSIQGTAKSKIALVENKIDEARELLTEAQRIANEYGLNKLAQRISFEHDELLDKLDKWENYGKKEEYLFERLQSTSLDESLNRISGKTEIEIPQKETELSIMLLVLSKTGYTIFSNPFTADFAIDESYFGEFLSSFNRFSDKIFSETLDRIKIGEFTVLLRNLESFSVCYVFKGQSYSAGQKLNNFIESVKENPKITRKELSQKIGITDDGIKYHLKNMQKEGIIERIGPDKGGYWKVNAIRT